MSPSRATPDVLIVGGGVVGLSLADQLSREGAAVHVVDRGPIGRAASWAGAGILPPARAESALHPLERLRGIANRLHPIWAQRLRDETGIDTGFLRCGGLYVARTAGESAALAGLTALFAAEQVPFERWTAEECRSQWPALDAQPPIHSALYTPDEWQLRNPRHLRALKESCRLRGVEFFAHEPITGWERTEHRMVAAISAHSRWEAGQFCITAGAWSHLLLDDLGIANGVYPVRGQMVLFHLPRMLFPCVINEGTRYLVPREDGRILAGSTEEEVGFDSGTTEEAVTGLIDFAHSLVPELGRAHVESTWAGLRPASFDGLPYMGRLPRTENAFVAAGHFRSGLSLSPAIAELMAACMRGEATEVDLSSFRVDRVAPTPAEPPTHPAHFGGGAQ